jgi:glycosyltransferase involved in cell wall biosynthesis
METVDELGPLGFAKRFLYKLWFAYHKNVTGYLAIGYKTSQWIIDRGVSKSKVFEFAYFLPVPEVSIYLELNEHHSVCVQKISIAFIGRVDSRKGLDLLIDAASQIQ